MIRKTVKAVREATFCIQLPNNSHKGMPTPTGTGFFVSPDGWFVTAAHVVAKSATSTSEARDDIDRALLMKEPNSIGTGRMCQFVTLEHFLPKFDFALLYVDFDKNSNKAWLKDRNAFPFINVSTRTLEIGEPVYSYGYPLSSGAILQSGTVTVGQTQLSPRLTSAIVSSDLDKTQMIMTSSDPKNLVLDKALNYGNSGGPIIASETGNVHALCSRFQPVYVPQEHMKDQNGQILNIMVPSLYSVVLSLNNVQIIDLLKSVGIPIVND